MSSSQQPAEDDRLAEHRGRLGERQRRVLMEDPLAGGQGEVHAVAELVGERQHVAAAGRCSSAARRGTPRAPSTAQNAPPRLAGRTGASIRRSSKKRLASAPSSGEKEA